MPFQPAPSFLNDRYRVTTGSRSDVEVKVKTLFIANAPEKSHESAVALPFNPDEDTPPTLNPAPPTHRASADSGKPAKHARAILRIETDITSQAPHILSTVDPSGSAIVLLDDEQFLLLQVIQQANMM